MQNTITIATCTLGDSASRLRIFLHDLHRFTKEKFRHIVIDDGTLNPVHRELQEATCSIFGADWYENPSLVYGISYAWNAALDKVKTPWAFCIEDGLRHSMGWLETALDFVKHIGDNEWHGHKVGMAGFSSLQDWLLAVGGAWPGIDIMDTFKNGCPRFWNDWNDGYWCWNRLLPGIRKACEGDTSSWTNDVIQFKELVTGNMPEDLPPMEREQRWLKWRTNDHWPQRRTAFCGWYPGAFMLVNMDAWRRVGKFRNGCTFFEGHLGTRMGMCGYLSLCVESPPFLHTPSLGFKANDHGKTPRHHEDTAKLFMQDFAFDNMEAPNVLANAVVSLEKQKAINEDLATVKLYMDKGWEKWL